MGSGTSEEAASGGHTAVVDLLASEFGAWIVVGCLIRAALWFHAAMIDRLVERYGVDPIAVDGAGWTALHPSRRAVGSSLAGTESY